MRPDVARISAEKIEVGESSLARRVFLRRCQRGDCEAQRWATTTWKRKEGKCSIDRAVWSDLRPEGRPGLQGVIGDMEHAYKLPRYCGQHRFKLSFTPNDNSPYRQT